MQILNRYIRHVVLSSTLVVVIVLLGVESLGQLIAELGIAGTNNYGIDVVLMYILMQLPAVLYFMFPVAAFIGSLIGLGRLASGSELTVMRANGVSIAQITWAVVKTAIMMLIFVTFIGEVLAPRLQIDAELMRSDALNKKSYFMVEGDIWLKHDNRYVHIDAIQDATHMSGISDFVFNGMQLLSAAYAESATKLNNHWQLNDVSKTIFTPKHTRIEHHKTEWLGLKLEPNKLHSFEEMSLEGSLVDLWQVIRVRKEAGLINSLFQLTFWQRIAQPITTLVVICLSIPFIFGSLRSVSTSVRILTGVGLGFVLYMCSRFFGPIVLLYQFPAWLAALLPTLLFFIVYLFMLRRTV